MYKHVKGVVEVVVEEFEETSANHLSQYRLGVEGHAAWRENYMQEAMTMLAGSGYGLPSNPSDKGFREMRRRTLQVEEELSQSRRVSACPGSSSDTARSGAAAPGRPRRSVMGMGKGAMEMSEERVALSARRRSRIPVSEKSPEETNTGSEHVSNAALQGRRRAAGGVRDSMCPSLESGGRSEALSNRRRSRMPAREEANTVHIAVEREEMGRIAASSEQISQPRRSVMGGGRHSVMGPRERGGQRSALSARRVSRMPPVSVTTSSFPAAVVHDVVVAVEAAEVAEEEAIKASGSPQSVSVSVSVPTILPAGKGGPKRPRRRMMGGVDKLLEPRAGGPISARRRSCMPGKEASGGSEEVREELPVLKKESDTVKDSAIAEAVVPHSRAQTVRQSLCRASLSTTPGGRNALSARRKSRMPKKKETKVVEAEQCMEETEKKNTRERRTRAAKKVESLGEEEEEEDEEEEEMTTTVNERNVKETANMIIEADYNMVEDNYEEKQTQVGGEVDEVVKNEEENEEEVEAEVEEKEEEKEELEDGEKQSNEDSCVWDVLSGLRRHAVGVKRSKLDENGIVIAYSERRLESKLRAMEAEAAELHRRQMEEEEKKKKKKSVTTHVPSPAVTHTEAARGRKSSASLVESDSDFSVETLGNAGEESESETEELTEKGERGRRVTDEVEDEMVDEDEEEDQIESDDDEEEGEEEEVGVEEVGEKEEGDEVERDEEEEEDVEEQCTVVIRPNRGVGKLEVAVQSVARTRKRSRGNEKKTAGAVENRRVEVEEREEDGKEIGEVDSIKEDRDEEQVDEEDSEDDSVTMDLVNTGEIVHPPRPSSRSSRTSRSTRQSSVRSSSISKSQQHAPRASSIATYTGSSPSFINDASSMATVQKEVTPLLRKRSSTSTKTSVSSGAKRKSFSRAFKNSPARRVNIKVEESAAETGAPPSKKTRRSSSSSPTTMTEAAADTSPNVWNKPVTSSVSTTTDKVVTATSLETSLAKTADTILTLKERIEMMKKRTHQKMGIKPDTHLSIVSTSTPSSSSSSTTTPSTTTTVSPITQVTSTAVIPPTASATNTASQVTETVTCAKSDFVEEVSIGSSTASSIIDMEEKLATSFLAEERERRKRENLEEFKKRQEERKRSRKEEKERRAIQKKNREFLLQAVHKKVEATQATSSKATTTTTTSTANTNAATSTMDSSRIIRMEGAGVKRSGPSTAAANGADGGRSREESLAKRMKKTASSSTFQPTLSSASSQNIASSSLTSFSTLAPVASKMRAKLETNKTIKREQVNEKKPESEPTTEPTDSNMFVSEQDELFFGFADELNKLIAVSTTSLNSERNGKDHMTKGGDVEDDGVEGEGRDSPFCQDQFGGNDHGSGAPAEDLLIIDNVPCSNALPSSTSVTSTSSSLPMSPSRMSPQASAAAVDDFVFVTPIKKVPQQQSHIQTSTSTNTPKSNFASIPTGLPAFSPIPSRLRSDATSSRICTTPGKSGFSTPPQRSASVSRKLSVNWATPSPKKRPLLNKDGRQDASETTPSTPALQMDRLASPTVGRTPPPPSMPKYPFASPTPQQTTRIDPSKLLMAMTLNKENHQLARPGNNPSAASQTGAHRTVSVLSHTSASVLLRSPAAAGSPQTKITIPLSPGDSQDDSDLEAKKRKRRPKLPNWAQSPMLKQRLALQQQQDPDAIFPRVQGCDLNEIFASEKKSRLGDISRARKRPHNNRSDSANWELDKLTPEEEAEYKKRMGYMANVTAAGLR